MQQISNDELLLEQHKKYVYDLEKSTDIDDIGNYLTSHLKMGGGYWSLTSLSVMKEELTEKKKDSIMEWLYECQNEDGGFGGNIGHDSHITSSHYSLLISIVLDRLEQFKQKCADKLIQYTLGLYDKENGGFWGDSCKLEQDLRFTYCTVSTLSILQKQDLLCVQQVVQFILNCYNYDGSFGGIPDMESHAAYVFCAIGSLKILDKLDLIDTSKLAIWLSERQTVSGGFNGRPEKLPDVCYSWWIYSSLVMIQMQHCVDQNALVKYILLCQDQQGGISDKPGNCQDVFHTFFGLAALSLLPSSHQQSLSPIHPVYAIPSRFLSNSSLSHL